MLKGAPTSICAYEAISLKSIFQRKCFCIKTILPMQKMLWLLKIIFKGGFKKFIAKDFFKIAPLVFKESRWEFWKVLITISLNSQFLEQNIPPKLYYTILMFCCGLKVVEWKVEGIVGRIEIWYWPYKKMWWNNLCKTMLWLVFRSWSNYSRKSDGNCWRILSLYG